VSTETKARRLRDVQARGDRRLGDWIVVTRFFNERPGVYLTAWEVARTPAVAARPREGAPQRASRGTAGCVGGPDLVTTGRSTSGEGRCDGVPEIAPKLRVEVVKQLLSASMGRGAPPADATPDEVSAAALSRRVAGQIVARDMQDRGLLPRPPTVLDLQLGQLQALAAAYGIVSRWDVAVQLDRHLGDALKVLPTEEAEDVVRWLR
jgi:hypothetical protein